MSPNREESQRNLSPTTIRLGGATAGVVFALMLFAFVAESELTQVSYPCHFTYLPLKDSFVPNDLQYVQTTLGYRQPFFLLYVRRSSESSFV